VEAPHSLRFGLALETLRVHVVADVVVGPGSAFLPPLFTSVRAPKLSPNSRPLRHTSTHLPQTLTLPDTEPVPACWTYAERESVLRPRPNKHTRVLPCPAQ
jgi:hypothetical protein